MYFINAQLIQVSFRDYHPYSSDSGVDVRQNGDKIVKPRGVEVLHLSRDGNTYGTFCFDLYTEVVEIY